MLTNRFFCFRRKLLGYGDHDSREMIPRTVACGNTLAADTEHPVGGRSGRNGQHHGAFQCGNLRFAAEQGRRDRDLHVATDVLSLALEGWVRLDFNLDQEVALWAAVPSGFALSGQAEDSASVDAGWNLDVDT